MMLTIKSVENRDLGSYRCIAKNSLGEVESNIRLYGKTRRGTNNSNTKQKKKKGRRFFQHFDGPSIDDTIKSLESISRIQSDR